MIIERCLRACVLLALAATTACTAQTEERDSTRGAQGFSCHDPATTGDPMTTACGACATSVCGVDPYCCSTAWDSICVREAASYCSPPPPPACAHSVCALGKPLAADCSSCVSDICSVKPQCCTDGWTAECAHEAQVRCNVTCGGSCTTQSQCNPYGEKCCATDASYTAGYCEAPGVGCPYGDYH